MRITTMVVASAMLSMVLSTPAAAYSPPWEHDRLAKALQKTSADLIGKQPVLLQSVADEAASTTGSAIDALECYDVHVRYRRTDGGATTYTVNWCEAE